MNIHVYLCDLHARRVYIPVYVMYIFGDICYINNKIKNLTNIITLYILGLFEKIIYM